MVKEYFYYCKAKKKTGKPWVKMDEMGKIKEYSSGMRIRGKKIKKIETSFNNAFGAAKRNGATMILEVEYNK